MFGSSNRIKGKFFKAWQTVSLEQHKCHPITMLKYVVLQLTMKQEESDNVDEQSERANIENEKGVMNLFRLVEALQRLDEYGEAEGDEKHGID